MGKGKSKGRGQLSSFERMPSEADTIISWAASALADRDLTQTEIYGEFVTRCQALMAEHRGELEFAIPAFASFNRYSIRLARMTRRSDETREIVKVLADKYTVKSSDDLAVILGETIKSLVYFMVADADEDADPKDVLFLANAYKAAQAAQNMSSDRKTKSDKQLAERVTEAVDTVAKAKGMTAETATAIKAQILGVQG